MSRPMGFLWPSTVALVSAWRAAYPRVGAVHALQGLLAGAGLCVQEEPLGCPAATEDFSERSAFHVVAGRTLSAHGPVAVS